MQNSSEKIMITGALGQIGSDLTAKLCEIYGSENVIASDIRDFGEGISPAGQYEKIDVMDEKLLGNYIIENKITTVYHLASLLSGTAEKQPRLAWKLNIDPLLHLCELAKDGHLKKIFWPSSIAVFGYGIPKNKVEQDVVLNPSTVYGISKLAGEKWCEYYYNKYGVDARSLRLPGLISWKTPAGGGTTDYAVEIFYKAIENGHYTSFISENTAMPMLYMDDAINAIIQLMQADSKQISVRNSYNLGGLSFTPAELSEEIKKVLPNFNIDYQPDFRQAIADSWPASIDDSVAKKDWNLSYKFDTKAMVADMIINLTHKLKK